jgi:hypothetical protein
LPASWFTAMKSKASDGQRFWLFAFRPLKSSTTVARVFGSLRAPLRRVTRALGSSTPAENRPLGR